MKRGKCGDKLHLQWIQTVNVTLSLPSLEVATHIPCQWVHPEFLLHTRILFGGSLGGLNWLFRASGLTEVISYRNFEPHIMFPPFLPSASPLLLISFPCSSSSSSSPSPLLPSPSPLRRLPSSSTAVFDSLFSVLQCLDQLYFQTFVC